MSLQRNYYEVLGIPPGATTDQIKKKYRELARQFHPDIAQDKALGQRVFTQINQAYSVLANPERRAQYNSILSNSPVNAPSANAPSAAPKAAPAPVQPPSPQRTQAVAGLLGRAENAIMAGKPVEARAFCVKVLEIDARNMRALEVLGDALVQMGRREEAAVQYRNALQVAPSTLIQAKLNRVTQTAPSTRTVPPQAAPPPRQPTPPAQHTSGAQRANPPAERTNPPGNGETGKSGGLFGRLLGRK